MKYPLASYCLVLTIILSSEAQAVDVCRISVDDGSGVVQVSASGVVGSLSWGDVEGHEINSFQNASSCTRNNIAKDCELGVPGTQKQIVPPGRCQIWVSDDSGLNSCLARLFGCTPDRTATGSVVPFAGAENLVPVGWLLADGSSVSRVIFFDLFAILGVSHGMGDGSTTFKLPDYRGRFIRGIDGTAGRDPDSMSRQAMNPGGNTGNVVGSVQSEATALPNDALTLTQAGIHSHGMDGSGNHSHAYTDKNLTTIISPIVSLLNGPLPAPIGSESIARTTASSGVHTHVIQSSGLHAHTIEGGDLETRPENAYVNWIIKY